LVRDPPHQRRGLQSADDPVVWDYAAKHGLTIVTKDSDFNSLSFLFGAPPKVIWVQLGNCSTHDVEMVLRARRANLLEFAGDPDSALLVLGRNPIG
jgi:predicted nuclease of predicted toxin-antitoxin system